MEKRNENKALVKRTSTEIVKVGNSLNITSKILGENFSREVSRILFKGELVNELKELGSIRSISSDSNNTFIYATSEKSSISIFDANKKQRIGKNNFNGHFETVAFNPVNNTIAIASGRNIYITEKIDYKIIQTLEGHEREINVLAFSNDGRYLFSGSSDKTIRVWEIDGGYSFYLGSNSWRLTKSLKGHNWLINSLKISNDNKYLYSGGWDSYVIKWDINTLSEFDRFDCKATGGIKCLELTNNGKYIITGGGDQTVRVFDTTNHNLFSESQGHKDFVSCLTVSSNDKMVFSGGWDGQIFCWLLPELQLIKGYSAHDGRINSIKLSIDPSYLLSGCSDGDLKCWI